MKYNITFYLSLVFIMLIPFALADETNSTNGNTTLEDINSTSQVNTTLSEETNMTDSSDIGNISDTPENNTTINDSIIIDDVLEDNVTANDSALLFVEEIEDITLLTVSPLEFPQGDVILTINVENTGTKTLTNIVPLITGNGFSTYQVVSLDSLTPGENGTLYAFSQMSTTGNILLTITIVDKTFYQTVSVTGPVQEDAAALQEDLEALSLLATSLEDAYEALENEIEIKSDSYLVPDLSLDEIKNYIREAQSHILAGNVEEANISLILAEKVYNEEKAKLEAAEKKSWFDLIKENIILISSFIGAIITLLTFYEYMRRKQAGLYEKIKEFKVNKDTKIEVLKKKSSEKDDDAEVLEQENILLKDKK